MSCKNESTTATIKENKLAKMPSSQNRNEDTNIVQKLDSSNFLDEKTTVPFQTSINIKNGFEKAIKGMKKMEDKTINGNTVFQIFKEIGNTDGPEWDYKSVIRIGDYYLPVHLGIDHSVLVLNAVYNDKMQEVMLNTGCFSDAGCLNNTMILRTFEKEPFTLTDFGSNATFYRTTKDFDSYYYLVDHQKLQKVLDSGELVIIDRDYIHSLLVVQSYIPYERGFAKGIFTQKLKVELAG
jgi:hypothetical protein